LLAFPITVGFLAIPLLDFFHSVLALTSLTILLLAIVTLLWFFYSFFVRRMLRARRIANARLKRLMREREESELGGRRG
jgi:hypothetical protein